MSRTTESSGRFLEALLSYIKLLAAHLKTIINACYSWETVFLLKLFDRVGKKF